MMQGMTDSLFAPQFEELATNIKTASQTTSADIIQQVLHQIESLLQPLNSLLQFPKKDTTHGAQLRLGKPVINGVERKVNEQFIADATILSDQLDLDEYAASELLMYGIQQQARYDRTALDTSFILYHRERIAILHCLHAIFDNTSGNTQTGHGWTTKVKRVQESLLSQVAYKHSLPERVLQATENVKNQIKTLKDNISETSALVAQIGMAINNDRVDYLEQERSLLAVVFFDLAMYHGISPAAMEATIVILKTATLADRLTTHLAAALMASMGLSPKHALLRGKPSDYLPAHARSAQYKSQISAALGTSDQWRVPSLHAMLQFQFCQYLIAVFPSSQSDMLRDYDVVEAQADRAITSNALQFACNFLLGFRSQVYVSDTEFEVPFELSNQALGILDSTADGNDGPQGKPVRITTDQSLQEGILRLLEITIQDFVFSMVPLIRKIKHREEDVVLHQQAHRQSQPATTNPRYDLEALFTLVALVYKDRPDAGINYWPTGDDRLYTFVKLGAECRVMARSYFEMLCSLATGLQSSKCAFEFLKADGGRYGTLSSTTSSLCSWVKLFEAINLYTNSYTQMAASREVIEIKPEELTLLKTLLSLLRIVAQYSPLARSALNDTKQFRVVHMLFRFFVCPVPADLKAAILDTISAFSAPSNISGSETALLVWEYLEQARVLPRTYTNYPVDQIANQQAGANVTQQEREQRDLGIAFDIESIEAVNESYPETIALTKLLDSLIQNPTNANDFLTGGSPSIPEQLGSPYREPGVAPYVRFVMDTVFVKALSRKYRIASDKWVVINAALSLIEKCLAMFDIGALLEGQRAARNQEQRGVELGRMAAVKAALHPAFDIMTRILTGSDILTEMLKIVKTGVAALNRDGCSPHLRSSVARCFRILSRAMQLQDIFIDHLVPALHAYGGTDNYPNSLASLEQHLSFYHESIVDIAGYINTNTADEICALSVSILNRLSASADMNARVQQQNGMVTNRLVGIIESSRESRQILYGYVQKLENDGNGWVESQAIPMNFNPEDALIVKEVPGHVLQLQILQLLIDNLDESRNLPSIAHFLLGYPTKTFISRTSNSSPGLLDNSTMSVLHVILDLLRRGIQLPTDIEDIYSEPLYKVNPQLAEKCNELIFRLCADTQTTEVTMRFLRTREEFFYRQLHAIPAKFSKGLHGDHGFLVQADGTKIRASFPRLISQLYQRSWLLRTVALELRTTAESNQRKEAMKLLSLLYNNVESTNLNGEDNEIYTLEGPTDAVMEQPKMKILELLDSLDITWEDDLSPADDVSRKFFADVRDEACLERDDSGVEVIDSQRLFSLLMSRKADLESQNALMSQGNRAAAYAEIEAIMQQTVAKNHARKLEAGRKAAVDAWRELVEITLGPCYDMLKVDSREMLLYSILMAVLNMIQKGAVVEVNTTLSKVALSLMQRLRMDHFHQSILQATMVDPMDLDGRLPAERLLAVARGIIQCLLRPGNSMTRCNLYSTLVNYLQYTRSDKESPSGAWSSNGGHGNIGNGNMLLVDETGSRLLKIICHDASNVDQVCQIAAFTLLNALCALYEGEESNRVLVYIGQGNYLKGFIEAIVQDDEELQECVRSKVSRTLYVNEARLTLFLRVAQRRDGAEQLLSDGYFDSLSNNSNVISIRQELSADSFGVFEQTQCDRYHSIVYPMLQVGVAIVTSLGRNHRTAGYKAEVFLKNHQDTFAIILKDSSSTTSLNNLRDLRVVTSFMTQLAGRSTGESSFGPVLSTLHPLVLALVPKYFSLDRWASTLRPLNDEERYMCNTIASSLDSRSRMSVFERDARYLAKDIVKNLLSYSHLKADRPAPAELAQFTPVYSWTISGALSGREHDAGSSTPSLATLASFLIRNTEEVGEGMSRYQNLQYKLNNLATLMPEERLEIVEASSEPYVDDLVASQRDQLATQVLQQMLTSTSKDLISSLFTLETALLLFWQHLDHYIAFAVSGPADSLLASRLGASTFGTSVFGRSSQRNGNQAAMFSSGYGHQSKFATAAAVNAVNALGSVGGLQESKNYRPTSKEALTLKRDASLVLKTVLENLVGVELTRDMVGQDHASRNDFIRLLAGRIKALLE